jgi:hypothetical protein
VFIRSSILLELVEIDDSIPTYLAMEIVHMRPREQDFSKTSGPETGTLPYIWGYRGMFFIANIYSGLEWRLIINLMLVGSKS